MNFQNFLKKISIFQKKYSIPAQGYLRMKNGCRIRIPHPRKPPGHYLSHQNPKKNQTRRFRFCVFYENVHTNSASNRPTFHQHLQLCENGQQTYNFSFWLFSAPRSPFAASERLLASSLSWLSDDTIELG